MKNVPHGEVLLNRRNGHIILDHPASPLTSCYQFSFCMSAATYILLKMIFVVKNMKFARHICLGCIEPCLSQRFQKCSSLISSRLVGLKMNCRHGSQVAASCLSPLSISLKAITAILLLVALSKELYLVVTKCAHSFFLSAIDNLDM